MAHFDLSSCLASGCRRHRSLPDFSENCPQWRYDPADIEYLHVLVRYAQLKVELAELESRLHARSRADDGTLRKHLDGALRQVEQALPEAGDTARAGAASPVFRVNDLLVAAIPEFPAGDDSGCPGCTCQAGCSGATGCTNASTKNDGPDWDRVVLPELRVALAAALARFDEAPVGQGLRGRSRGQLETLAGQLKEAIEDLDRGR